MEEALLNKKTEYKRQLWHLCKIDAAISPKQLVSAGRAQDTQLRTHTPLLEHLVHHRKWLRSLISQELLSLRRCPLGSLR